MYLWRKNCRCLAVIFLFNLVVIILIANVSAIRINEIELNPEGTDAGGEWIELYSETEVNILGFSIRNYDNDTINLTNLYGNLSFSGFLIINFTSQWLDNTNETVFLLNDSIVIDETPIISDSANNNKSWQYCNGELIFEISTAGKENFCQQNQQNQSQQNNTGNQKDNQSQNIEEAGIFLDLEYDKEIKKGEEFGVEVKAYNLKTEKYDIKISIETSNEIISETYNEEKGEWQSSNYFINEIITGPGNKSKNLIIRINEKIENFSDKIRIIAKIRKTETNIIISEFSESIRVLEEKSINAEELEAEGENKTEENKIITLNKANKENIKSSQTYLSEAEKIRKYAIYGFIFLCLVFVILLIKVNLNKKLKRKEKRKQKKK